VGEQCYDPTLPFIGLEHAVTYPSSMRPLTPKEVFDYTEGQLRSCGSVYCDLWLVSARIDVAERDILYEVLSADERDRAGRFRFEEDRARSIHGRGGLRRILSSYCQVPPHRLEFYTGTYGKPQLVGGSAGLEFNVSHSGDYVLIGVTSGAQCGVDIECGRRDIEEVQIAERFFCPREVEWLLRTGNGFLRLWTAKEAILKAMGSGLSVPLSDIDVTDVLEGKATSATLRPPHGYAQKFWVSELSLVPNYAAAIATVGEQRVVRPMS